MTRAESAETSAIPHADTQYSTNHSHSTNHNNTHHNNTGIAPTVHRPLLIAIILGFSSFCASIMQSLVIPIQGELPQLLNASASTTAWVITATLLGSAVTMPVAGKLADLHGKKPVLVASAALLLIGSILCASTSTVSILLIGRVLQGMAMGYIPVAISFVKQILPARMVNPAMAAISATLGVGGALGLPLAAWIAQSYDWHILFWVAAVLAAIVLVLTATMLPFIRSEESGRLDIAGAIVLAIGLVSVLVAVTKGGTWGWTSLSTLGLIVGGVIVLLVFGFLQLRTEEPLVDLRTTASRPVLMTNLAAILIGFGMMASSIVVPQLLQLPKETGVGLGQTILQAGLWMAPGGLMMMMLSPVSSALLSRFGGKVAVITGAVVLGGGYFVAAFLMGSPWELMLASCISSAGVGIGYAAMPALIMANVPAHEMSSSVGVNTLMRSLGTTTASAVMASVLTSNVVDFGGFAVPTHSAFQLCFLIGAGAAIAGALLAFAIPSARAARKDSGAEATSAERELELADA